MARVSSAREDMLSAAVELFRERGYEGVGVAELLSKSGAPRGSLYFHFPGGKEQIGAEVVARVGAVVAARFRELHESGVDIDTFIERVFKTTAKECKERQYKASCPMAAIATGFGNDNPKLAAAVRTAFSSWEAEMRNAAQARGMSEADATVFASAMLAAMEGAFVTSKALESSAPHKNASRAIQALAAALMPH
ncbi:MAG TPA: TetR/AcrR family transcriptional regulator [Vitreimonas sp.]|uniref:TetR/AcrR family transcriptional regulator n=1 Tax=Vitreimonas sp. TaxID=3069702 RepID=UPI002D29A008|nr:TetR/AcrR family transcriptional regulator [Vitreimonas sp.]HYD88141.1 TetR/AcrR family transcriptional regulator [Vitreimonas sp.]